MLIRSVPKYPVAPPVIHGLYYSLCGPWFSRVCHSSDRDRRTSGGISQAPGCYLQLKVQMKRVKAIHLRGMIPIF
ncbi:hypothetical protein BDQ12DRAFT_691419, partial [Crucibulum laeve]